MHSLIQTMHEERNDTYFMCIEIIDKAYKSLKLLSALSMISEVVRTLYSQTSL